MKITLGLAVGLTTEQRDPLDYIRQLALESDASVVQLNLGPAVLRINVSLVSAAQLKRVTPNERFAVVVTTTERLYLFINPNLAHTPVNREKLVSFMALNAFLTATRTSDAYPDFIKIEERPIIIEMAYAKSLLTPKEYESYKLWRAKIDRTGFFDSLEWETKVELTLRKLPQIISGIIRIAELEKDNFEAQRNVPMVQ
ncbi:hypothetical protein HZC08_00600 [Candidatus Micrarchaeota archaeon]|nr:hypothetical protein [Candidatus Micrarchaeota archaeon]